MVTLEAELGEDQDSLYGTPEGASLCFSLILVGLMVAILFCYKLREMQHSHKSEPSLSVQPEKEGVRQMKGSGAGGPVFRGAESGPGGGDGQS